MIYIYFRNNKLNRHHPSNPMNADRVCAEVPQISTQIYRGNLIGFIKTRMNETKRFNPPMHFVNNPKCLFVLCLTALKNKKAGYGLKIILYAMLKFTH